MKENEVDTSFSDHTKLCVLNKLKQRLLHVKEDYCCL